MGVERNKRARSAEGLRLSVEKQRELGFLTIRGIHTIIPDIVYRESRAILPFLDARLCGHDEVKDRVVCYELLFKEVRGK